MRQDKFILKSPFKPMGDQTTAIDKLVDSINDGNQYQTLLGVTGSGKTFTMANIIEKLNRPTLIISHNKTLAAQLHSEMKEFFPNNIVEYFVSYYDYYQPEAYVASTDTYIEKDSQINDEIEKLRHSATAALSERRDVIIVASVSCIYGLGSPFDYENQMLSLRPSMIKSREEILDKLVEIQYQRNDISFERGTFRVRGDVIDIFAAGAENPVRIELFGDEIESIKEFNSITGKMIGERTHVAIYPASHYVTSPENMKRALVTIGEELEDRIKWFKDRDMLVEAQRIEQRTRYDMQMLEEIGSCKGIENYSRHLNGLKPNAPPYTLMDYFPEDYLIIIDESHVMLPQLKAMYKSDRARKQSLVDYGFRLPSALDNRPLSYEEFEYSSPQTLYVSATPGTVELENSNGITAEQVIRPTGLLDPIIEVEKKDGQIDNLIKHLNEVIGKGLRAFVTTITKKMAEKLTDHLSSYGFKVRYLHSDVDTLKRLELIRDLRQGKFDILIGINLLREGLDVPEVGLVAILDADMVGFLRTYGSLIQMIGRAARNADGKVIMYADEITPAMNLAITETKRRRSIQETYNSEHGIVPKTIVKPIREVIEATKELKESTFKGKKKSELTQKELESYIKALEKEMLDAADNLQFEQAALLRDEIAKLRKKSGI